MAVYEDPAAALPEVVEGVRVFAKAALSGEIYIDEAAMQDIVSQFRRVKDEIDAMVVDDSTAVQGSSSFLGANPVGEGMSLKFNRRVAGETFSMHTVLASYRDQLNKAESALQASLRQYQETDAQNAANFRPVG